MTKSLATNLICIALTIIGYFSPIYQTQIFNTGMYAISGSITNWLAIYMLFEKVPFLYGSGVIPNQFEEFKSGIKKLIITEFFSKQHIEKFVQSGNFSTQDITNNIDKNKIFDHLVEAIMESSFGGMLSMFGGKGALEGLREPISKKISEIAEDFASNSLSGDKIDVLLSKVEEIIDARLNQLTPEMVKNIIQEMIQKHLGWLVVWGGVFGALIGFVASFIS